MASLTEVSILSRKIIRYGIYFIILLIIARFVFRIGVSVYKRIFPPPKPKPTVAFGVLPKLPFPDKPKPPNLNFNLELATGNLPVFPEQIEVFFMPSLQTRISALDEAKTKAIALGFEAEGKILAETIPNVYIFPKKNLPSSLTMNIVTQVFSISYNIDQDPSVIQGIPPDSESAILKFKNLLARGGFLTQDINEGVATYEYLRLEQGKFVKAISLSEANFTKVNLFRKPMGSSKYPSVTPDMPEANVWAIIAGGRDKPVIAAEYHYFPIDEQKSATYPLKSADMAWEELKQGKGYIANLGNNNENITIRKVYLAYYDAGQYTPYYQPVVVFEGDNDFYAYVPAVTNDFYGKEPNRQ